MRRQDSSLGQSDQSQNFFQNTSKFHEKLRYQISSYYTATDDLIQEEQQGSFNSHIATRIVNISYAIMSADVPYRQL